MLGHARVLQRCRFINTNVAVGSTSVATKVHMLSLCIIRDSSPL
jgi:hypothetical protein